MSADNGIYMLKSKDGYRVIKASAIENVWLNYDELDPNYLKKYFGKAEVFIDRSKAFDEALRLESQGTTEYGIKTIPGWEDKEFPV